MKWKMENGKIENGEEGRFYYNLLLNLHFQLI